MVFIWDVAGLMAEGRETIWGHTLNSEESNFLLYFIAKANHTAKSAPVGEGKYNSLIGRNSMYKIYHSTW